MTDLQSYTKVKRLGRIMNDSWVCRLGCYHEVKIDTDCECVCHNSAFNCLKIRNYEVKNRLKMV